METANALAIRSRLTLFGKIRRVLALFVRALSSSY